MDKQQQIQIIEILFPVYGEILTDKMREVIEMYFFEDLSLAEIAEEKGISRNAAHTKIKTAISKMQKLEKKLKVISLKNQIKKELDETNIVDLRENLRNLVE